MKNITKEEQEIYRWIDIVLVNKKEEDKYRNAAISGLGNVITD